VKEKKITFFEGKKTDNIYKNNWTLFFIFYKSLCKFIDKRLWSTSTSICKTYSYWILHGYWYSYCTHTLHTHFFIFKPWYSYDTAVVLSG